MTFGKMLYVTHFKKKSGPTLYCVIILMLMLTSDCGALARTASTAVVDATSSTVAPFHASTFENFTTRQPAADATDAYIVFGSDAIYCLFLVRQTEVPITDKQRRTGPG